MRTIKVAIIQGIQKLTKFIKSGNKFPLYAPNRIVIRPSENTEVENQVKVKVSNGILSSVVHLPTIQIIESKLQNSNYAREVTKVLTLNVFTPAKYF